ncbi:MAG: hypothetical protein ACPLRN_03795 [Microgenomates group bacterium]
MINFLIVGNLLMIVVFFLRWKTLPPQVPLFYSQPVGESQLADTWLIFLIPILLNLIYFLNNYLYQKFFLNYTITKKIFEYFALFLTISFTLIFIRIILLVS